MLEMLLDKKLLFVLMGMLTGLGVADKCIVSMTMKRMVEAAGSMSKSNHPLMRLVRAKFEHACMISDTVENVGVFVDLALAALLLIALVMGWRQGFMQALTRILVVVAALLLAGWIAGKLAEPAARWLEPVLTEKLEQRLTAQGNTSDAGEMLAAFGFEGDTLSKLVDSAVQKAQQAGETLLSAVVSTALRSAAYAVVYVVSFLLLLVVLRLALSPLHLFTKLPVVHGVNALLGGALGLVKGALLVFLAVWVLQKLQLLVTPELVDKTVLLKFFARNSPIDLIAKL